MRKALQGFDKGLTDKKAVIQGILQGADGRQSDGLNRSSDDVRRKTDGAKGSGYSVTILKNNRKE